MYTKSLKSKVIGLRIQHVIMDHLDLMKVKHLIRSWRSVKALVQNNILEVFIILFQNNQRRRHTVLMGLFHEIEKNGSLIRREMTFLCKANNKK